ncbi:MAG: alanine dehydrogenase [Lentimicrobiaceae bacterium]|nr:alanine dehydrogenase [Lentimicrobiaceae bacterium]MCO5267001.1 alanine dehydrogenase [Lentimicrobium sp.]
MEEQKRDFIMFPAHSAGLMPQEERLEIPNKACKLSIGIPKETAFLENRISLVPEAVALLVNEGHKVIVENDAGAAAHYSNNQYSDAGAEIAYDSSTVFQSDVLIKVAPATLTEIEMMKGKQVLLSSLNLAGLSDGYFRQLAAKRITAIAFEYIKDRDSNYPVIRAMSEIAGNTSILIAAEYLSHPDYGRGLMFGGLSGISPTEVVILGAGTVGEFATRAAMGMGAMVKVFDSSVYRLRRLQNNIGTRIFTSVIQPQPLSDALHTADVAIGAIRSQAGLSPVCVSEGMVQQMRAGAIIIDVSIDQGGCFETSVLTDHKKPVFEKYGVTHYCVPNIASKVPRTASRALSNLLAPIILKIGEEGGISNILRADSGVRHGVYLYNGISTNRYISEYFHLPHKDIELLIAAFH